MNPTATAPAAPQPAVDNAPAPAAIPAPNLVENIPVHTPGQAPVAPSEDAELDKIMQDVGQELHKEDKPPKTSHFWKFGRRNKKEANFSTQLTIKNAPRPVVNDIVAPPAAAPPKPAQAAKHLLPSTPAPHSRVKPAAQKPLKKPQVPKIPKQHSLPVMVTVLTILVTAALAAAAYKAFK